MKEREEYDVQVLFEVSKYNYIKYMSYKNNLPFEINNEYEKILNARYTKAYRIKRRLVYLLSHYKYIWFCTFTFDDYYITKSTRTKRDLIKSCIDQLDFKYILNIDYGKTTEREHYHCILATDQDLNINDLFKASYPCFSLSIQCKTGINDFNRLRKYIDKLVNHCIKATTKKQRIVYNFKGYDTFIYPTSYDRTMAFNLDYDSLFL